MVSVAALVDGGFSVFVFCLLLFRKPFLPRTPAFFNCGKLLQPRVLSSASESRRIAFILPVLYLGLGLSLVVASAASSEAPLVQAIAWMFFSAAVALHPASNEISTAVGAETALYPIIHLLIHLLSGTGGAYIFALSLATAAFGIFSLLARITERASPQQYTTIGLDFDEDDETNRAGAPVSVDTASGFELLSCSWLSDIIRVGATRAITADDVPSMREKHKARNVLDNELMPEWQRSKPDLFGTLIAAFGWPLAAAGGIKVLSDGCNFLGPILLQRIIVFMDTPEKPFEEGFLLAVGLMAAQIAQTVLFSSVFNIGTLVSVRLRGALTAMIFEKAVRLSPDARELFPSGTVQNLVSTDTSKVSELALNCNMLWNAALQIVVALLLLVNLLGAPTSFVGFMVLVATSPIQQRLLRSMRSVREETMKYSDRRIGVISEVLRGIQIVKLFAWKISFIERIAGIREWEMSKVRRGMVLVAANKTIVGSIPVVLSTVTFSVYALLRNSLDASRIFPAIALFNVLRPPLLILPKVLVAFAQATVSIERIQKFLVAKEKRDDSTERAAQCPADCDAYAKDASITWSSGISVASTPVLSNITMELRRGSLTCVVGSTGSGKSTLLSGLLGEAFVTSGSAGLCPGRSVALVEQSAFVFNASLKDNILFGTPYDAQKYEEALEVSALRTDLGNLQDGDETELGGHGVNLSGGQKQRLSIARAVYSDADVYVFDDPFSALDAHVAQYVFQKCILEKLSNKSVLLVTNQTHLIASNDVDEVVHLDDHSIRQKGTIRDLIESSSELGKELKESITRSGKTMDQSTEDEMTDLSSTVTKEPEQQVAAKPATKLVQAETVVEGDVDGSIYFLYINACGGLLIVVALIFANVASQMFSILSGLWLADWSTQSISPDPGLWGYLSVYVALGLAAVLVTALSGLCLAYVSYRGSLVMHERMLQTVLGAPMSWFDSVPTGRILNRFSGDMDKVDNTLLSSLQSLLRMVLSLLGTIGLTIYVMPAFLIPIVVISATFLAIQGYYRKASVGLRRVEAVTRSPLFNHVSETLDGITTIRAFNRTTHMVSDAHFFIEEYSKLSFFVLSSNQWISVRVEVLSSTLLFASAILGILERGILASALVGLVLSYSTQLTVGLAKAIRLATEAESQMAAVERVAEYTSAPPFPQEEPEAPKQPPPSWPRRGDLEFKDVVMRYRPDLPPVLNGVSFYIKSGERVGVVGRTGAGKSSLLQALFRLVPMERGKVVIDSLDASDVPLDDLRGRMVIIPQDPVLFSGTVRSNLDPFAEAHDAAIWGVLRSCGIVDLVSASPSGLDAVIAEGGSNLSAGQRQLLCLARAMLRDTSIIVLDEATATIDGSADAIIQKTLREQSSRTTLTIAHRINTIADSDKIIVMDHGQVAEFGSPAELLKIPNGIYASLFAESGTVEATDEMSESDCRDFAWSHQRQLTRACCYLRRAILQFDSLETRKAFEALGFSTDGYNAQLRKMVRCLGELADNHSRVGSDAKAHHHDRSMELTASEGLLHMAYAGPCHDHDHDQSEDQGSVTLRRRYSFRRADSLTSLSCPSWASRNAPEVRQSKLSKSFQPRINRWMSLSMGCLV